MVEISVTGREYKTDAAWRYKAREAARRKLRQERHPEITYIAWSPGLQLSKVGITTNLKRRLITLSNGCPDIRIIATFAQGRPLEKSLHQELSQFRIRGEWFSIPPEDILAIYLERAIKVAEVGHTKILKIEP